jgi:MvaI/BcnI restriction endonuclease family protein
MLSLSNVDIAQMLRQFVSHGVECTFLVPTRTGMDKSIMDATSSVREFLRVNGIHNYDNQSQGPDNKVVIPAKILSSGSISKTNISLYRPSTKSGDPRIWFSGLKKVASATDLLALIHKGDETLVVNCSTIDVGAELTNKSSPLSKFLGAQDLELNPIAHELLGKLEAICARGFVKTVRRGDTGVGATLEDLLGISANSSRAPDYKGIELKSGRLKSHETGRITVFSKTPDWSSSNLKGSTDILDKRGRYNEAKKRRQLFHTISALKANSYDLQLAVEHENDSLFQIFVKADSQIVEKDVVWPMQSLRESLVKKHRETFWVTAINNGAGTDEQFHYTKAQYTSGPRPDLFPMLLETGIITVDYTIREKANGKAKDQGYLFKLAAKDLRLLFKPPIQFELCGQ